MRLLYRKVNEIVVDAFGYETGSSGAQSPFSIVGDKVTLEPKPLTAFSDLKSSLVEDPERAN